MIEIKDDNDVLLQYPQGFESLKYHVFNSKDELNNYIFDIIDQNMIIHNKNVLYSLDVDKFISLSEASNDITLFFNTA